MNKFTLKQKVSRWIPKIIICFAILAFIICIPLSITKDMNIIEKVVFDILGIVFCTLIFYILIMDTLQGIYNHIDVDGEIMTIYEFGHNTVKINCHELDKITIFPSATYGGELIFFNYEKIYGKKSPVYKEEETKNYDLMLLYAKKNYLNVEVIDLWAKKESKGHSRNRKKM